MTPSPLGPCRKEVLGGITLKRRHSQLNFFEGALRAPLGPLGPGALAPATPLSRWACRAPLKNITDEFTHIVGVSNGMNLRVLLLFDVALCQKQI